METSIKYLTERYIEDDQSDQMPVNDLPYTDNINSKPELSETSNDTEYEYYLKSKEAPSVHNLYSKDIARNLRPYNKEEYISLAVALIKEKKIYFSILRKFVKLTYHRKNKAKLKKPLQRIISHRHLTNLDKAKEKIVICVTTGQSKKEKEKTTRQLSFVFNQLVFSKQKIKVIRCSLVCTVLRLVIKLAHKHKNRGLSFDDLVQEGNLGAVEASYQYDPGYFEKLAKAKHPEKVLGSKYKKFNLNRKENEISFASFSTFAFWWIRQSINRAIANKGRSIRWPAHIAEKINRLYRSEQFLLLEKGEIPTDQELAEYVVMPVKKVKQMRRLMIEKFSSLSVPISNRVERTKEETIADVKITSPETTALIIEQQNLTDEILSKLPPNKEIVIRMRFGIGLKQSYTLNEIGQVLNLTRERIRQIEEVALRWLRHPKKLKKWRQIAPDHY